MNPCIFSPAKDTAITINYLLRVDSDMTFKPTKRGIRTTPGVYFDIYPAH